MKAYNVVSGEVKEYDDKTIPLYAVAFSFAMEDRKTANDFCKASEVNKLEEFYKTLPITEAPNLIICGDWVASTKDLSPIQVGDKVRSYDFPGRKDCYYEGVVEKIGVFPEFPGSFSRYKILVHREVWDGKEVDFDDPYVFAPVNGTQSTLGEVINGVERI